MATRYQKELVWSLIEAAEAYQSCLERGLYGELEIEAYNNMIEIQKEILREMTRLNSKKKKQKS